MNGQFGRKIRKCVLNTKPNENRSFKTKVANVGGQENVKLCESITGLKCFKHFTEED
jgi:hypothetical protein